MVGSYAKPKVRLPGGGGAPEIATSAARSSSPWRKPRATFVAELDFITSLGPWRRAAITAQRLGIQTRGPTKLITDLCVLEPDAVTREMTVVSIHPGVTREQLQAATGWPLRYATSVTETPPPTVRELAVLRDLQERTRRAHAA